MDSFFFLLPWTRDKFFLQPFWKNLLLLSEVIE